MKLVKKTFDEKKNIIAKSAMILMLDVASRRSSKTFQEYVLSEAGKDTVIDLMQLYCTNDNHYDALNTLFTALTRFLNKKNISVAILKEYGAKMLSLAAEGKAENNLKFLKETMQLSGKIDTNIKLPQYNPPSKAFTKATIAFHKAREAHRTTAGQQIAEMCNHFQDILEQFRDTKNNASNKSLLQKQRFEALKKVQSMKAEATASFDSLMGISECFEKIDSEFVAQLVEASVALGRLDDMEEIYSKISFNNLDPGEARKIIDIILPELEKHSKNPEFSHQIYILKAIMLHKDGSDEKFKYAYKAYNTTPTDEILRFLCSMLWKAKRVTEITENAKKFQDRFVKEFWTKIDDIYSNPQSTDSEFFKHMQMAFFSNSYPYLNSELCLIISHIASQQKNTELLRSLCETTIMRNEDLEDCLFPILVSSYKINAECAYELMQMVRAANVLTKRNIGIQTAEFFILLLNGREDEANILLEQINLYCAENPKKAGKNQYIVNKDWVLTLIEKEKYEEALGYTKYLGIDEVKYNVYLKRLIAHKAMLDSAKEAEDTLKEIEEESPKEEKPLAQEDEISESSSDKESEEEEGYETSLPEKIADFAHLMESGQIEIENIPPKFIHAYFMYAKSMNSGMSNITTPQTEETWQFNGKVLSANNAVHLSNSHYYAMIDPDLKNCLEQQLQAKFSSILEKGNIVTRAQNQEGVKFLKKNKCVELKVLGDMGEYRLFTDKMYFNGSNYLIVFDKHGTHRDVKNLKTTMHVEYSPAEHLDTSDPTESGPQEYYNNLLGDFVF